jgi:hypothetical protein
MFEISDETREKMIVATREHFGITPEQHSDEDISAFIDTMVSLVKAQFGM